MESSKIEKDNVLLKKQRRKSANGEDKNLSRKTKELDRDRELLAVAFISTQQNLVHMHNLVERHILNSEVNCVRN